MRDDFSQKTIDTLAKRVGTRCSNPACRKLTTGPGVNHSRVVNIGVAAHITAASPGGPRFDPGLSADERKSPENGIWLCQNCAKLVDSDEERYSATQLRDWKERTEAEVLSCIEGRVDFSPEETWNPAEIEIRYEKVNITQRRHDYRFVVILTNRGNHRIECFHVDFECPSLVVERPEDHASYVLERSSWTRCFFRVTDEGTPQGIFPGDAKEIISVPYYVDQAIYRDNFFGRNRVFEESIRVTLYLEGYSPLTIERPFRDFHIF